MPHSRPSSWQQPQDSRPTSSIQPDRRASWVDGTRPVSMAVSTRTRRTSRPNSIAMEPIERVHSYFLDDASIYAAGDLELEPPSPRRDPDLIAADTFDSTESSDWLDEKKDYDLDLEANTDPLRSHRLSTQSRSRSAQSGRRSAQSGRLSSQSRRLSTQGPQREGITEKVNPAVSKDEPDNDPDLVTWDGPDDPANPKNWSFRRKWAATGMVSLFTVMSPISSSMIAPALPAISKDLGITQVVEAQVSLSIFVLAYALGPLILGPMSEIFGRTKVIQIANLFYLVFNLACGFAQTPAQLMIFRFFSGLGGCAPLSCGGGVLSDIWTSDQRGRAVALYSLAPLLGPAIGPIAGGFISEDTSWRWVFYASSCADAVVQVVGFFGLQETYAPRLLAHKARKLRKETGNENYHTQFERPEKTLLQILRVSCVRPFKLLFTQPIIVCLAIYMAYLYGIMYLVLSCFPSLWTKVYNESVGIGGLNYLALGIGLFLGSQVSAPINDKIYRTLKQRNGGKGEPEFRVPIMFVGACLMPIGLFTYGWTAQAKTHWIGPDIGVGIMGAGVIMGFQCIQTYMVDAYTRYAASALAATTCLRSLAGFGFPLFAPTMYNHLHYGWGNSLLGFVAIALGLPAPFLLWKYGPLLRARSQYAAGGGF